MLSEREPSSRAEHPMGVHAGPRCVVRERASLSRSVREKHVPTIVLSKYWTDVSVNLLH
jgi:hypothetical protein